MEKIIRRSNIQLVCGRAKPGASLAFLKNMAAFCREFNEETKGMGEHPVNVEITVFSDKSYKYKINNVPSSFLIKELIKNRDNKSVIKKSELEEIAGKISNSLNTEEFEKSIKIVTGTARSFGLKITD